MKHFADLASPTHVTPASNSKVNHVQGQVDELRGIMVKNIDQITARGERLELLINRTEDLQTNAVTFKRTSRNLERSMCMKNAKLGIFIAAVVLIVAYFSISAACGGLNWPSCV
jgi:vesicle-associated membrane protein 7